MLGRLGAGLYIAVAVTGGVVYLRLVKGWKLTDMLYVTRAGLKKSLAQVTEGAHADAAAWRCRHSNLCCENQFWSHLKSCRSAACGTAWPRAVPS